MSHLPVIVGFGGINAAGRSSFHHGYKRMVIDSLDKKEKGTTLFGLATLMGVVKEQNGQFLDSKGKPIIFDNISDSLEDDILKRTLLRQIAPDLFDVNAVPYNIPLIASSAENDDIRFVVAKRDLPKKIPENWKIADKSLEDQTVEVSIKGDFSFHSPDCKEATVKTAGQLPTGFNPGSYYNSTNHPRGLQMSIFGAWDALNSMGIDWELVKQSVKPDQIGVYAAAAQGQLDDNAGGGLMKAHVTGKRTSSRYLPLSLVDMASDFINAYVIGNVGHTGTQIGACATFLYNLELAIKEIFSGRRRVAIVGNAEAPILPEIMDGYKAMGALADDSRLLTASGGQTISHWDRAHSCRPFGENFGFTLSESTQFVVLFDDELAMELGAQIHASVADVFIKADGFKKSISSPGMGNLITLAKAVARHRAILGEHSLRNGSFVIAHGSGTPLNRTTESLGLNEVAKAFKIENWPVSAVKCYVGHSLSPASGDQLVAALGTWAYGKLPGIFTLDSIPEDVQRSNLNFSQSHLEIDPQKTNAALINSKGFGGNNATGLVFSPHVTLKMMQNKHGEKAIKKYLDKCQKAKEKAEEYDQQAINGSYQVHYKDHERVLKEEDLTLTDQTIKIPGFQQPVSLDLENPFDDMTSWQGTT